MQPDLLAISALWNLDHAIARARAALQQLDDKVAAIEQQIAALDAERDGLEARRRELVAVEARLQATLQQHDRQRKATQDLIDRGQAQSYDAAVRQVAQLAQLVDAAENEALTAIEEREAIEARLSALAAKLSLRDAAWKDAKAQRDAEAPTHHAIIVARTAERPEREAALPRHDLQKYELLRRKGSPVAQIDDGACEGCHAMVPRQMALEVALGRHTHTCKSCGRWLLDVRASDG